MALTDHENQQLARLADDVRRTDRRLHTALTTGRLYRSRYRLSIFLSAVAGLTLVITGNAVERPWLAIVGWLGLIAAALLNVGRDGCGRPGQDASPGASP
jgi:hypothetical protein